MGHDYLGKIAYSGRMGCFIQILPLGGEDWIYRLHGTHWCTVRKATENDKELFRNLQEECSFVVWQAESSLNGGEPFPVIVCEPPKAGREG